MKANQCDKCGETVPKANDASLFDAVLLNDPLIVLFSGSRHLLPVDGCEGSPSRAQYLEGQPRDPRPEWVYRPEREALYRAAYAKMQTEAAGADK